MLLVAWKLRFLLKYDITNRPEQYTPHILDIQFIAVCLFLVILRKSGDPFFQFITDITRACRFHLGT